MNRGARTAQEQQMHYANALAQQQSYSDLGEDLGTALGAGQEHFREKVGSLGPLGEAWRNYRKTDMPAGKIHMDFKEWKASEEGLGAQDKRLMGTKWGDRGAHETFMKEKHPKAAEYNKKYEELIASGMGPDDAKSALSQLQIDTGGAPEAGAFTNWLKGDEGKKFKKTWRDDQRADRQDERQVRRDERKAKRQEFFGGIGTGIGKFGQGLQKVGQTIIPGGETGYLEHGYKAPYGGLLGKMIRPGRHAVRKALGEGRFGDFKIGASGPTLPTQEEKEQAFSDWYLKVRKSKQAGGSADRKYYEELPKEQREFFDAYGGRGSSPIEQVLTRQGIW